MLRRWISILSAILFLCAFSFADTIYVKPLKITFTGKKLKHKNKGEIEFAIDIFNKIGKRYKRLVLLVPADKAEVKAGSAKIDLKDQLHFVERLYASAQKKLAEDKLDEAHKLFARAFSNLDIIDDDKQHEKLKRKIAQGLLRFELLEILKNFEADSTQKNKTKRLKSLCAGNNVVFEYADFLLVKLMLLFKLDEQNAQAPAEIKTLTKLLRDALKFKRFAYTALVEKRAKLADKAKEQTSKLQAQIAALYKQIKALYHKPNSVEALSALMQIGKTINSSALKKQFPKETAFFASQKRLLKKLAEIAQLAKVKKLIKFCGSEIDEKTNKDFQVKLAKLENKIKAWINFDSIAKVVDSDILRYKKDISEKQTAALAQLKKQTNGKKLVALIKLINAYRAELGIVPLLVQCRTLCKACRNYALELNSRKKISHIGVNGSTPATRAKAAGDSANKIGENLYRARKKSESPEVVFKAWLNNPGHHLNLIRKEFDSTGIANSQLDWVLLLAGP